MSGVAGRCLSVWREGRPARYHGPACRQRARRARLGVDPGRAALLAVAQRAEHAAVALRRAVTTGQDHDAAAAKLLAAVTALATLRECPNRNPPSPEPTAAIQHGSVPEFGHGYPTARIAPSARRPCSTIRRQRHGKRHETSDSAAHQPATAATADRPGHHAPGTKP
jgi:Mg-chelatase subunit ChlI